MHLILNGYMWVLNVHSYNVEVDATFYPAYDRAGAGDWSLSAVKRFHSLLATE